MALANGQAMYHFGSCCLVAMHNVYNVEQFCTLSMPCTINFHVCVWVECIWGLMIEFMEAEKQMMAKSVLVLVVVFIVLVTTNRLIHAYVDS